MNIDKPSYIEFFKSKFWQKLNDSLVPFTDKPIVKEEFLDVLYSEIVEFTYSPSHPREYIVYNKHNGISRYVPTFNRKDYCVYFLCIKLLENEIAVNRVDGTFGGWTLGNPIRLKEEQELIELDYIPANTINELSWTQEWRSYQAIAQKYKDIDDFKYFVNLDIANFYDTINLSILERKIRHATPTNMQEVVTLLMHFLHGWNRRLEGYSQKTVGIPQDEIGDISRILANFYLQDYDLEMKIICEKYGAKYIRFADDQIIFAKSKDEARIILFEASKSLFKINLNLNSGKAKEFESKLDFETYWSFDIFDLLSDKKNKELINEGIRLYFKRIDENVQFRNASVLKRILTIDISIIDSEFKHKILAIYYNVDVLSNLNLWHFKRIRILADSDDEFFALLDSLVPTALFNSFLFQLRNFYSKERIGHDLKQIDDRIKELKT